MAVQNATIGALRVQLGLDSAQFEAGLKSAQGNLKSFNKGILGELEAGFKSTAQRSGVLGTALSKMGVVGLGAGAALGALALAATKARAAFAFADDIADTANKLKVSTKALQEYRFAVHSLGGEYTDADAALEGFSKAFGNASAGLNKRALKPFQALFGPGFDPKQFVTTEDALQAVIEKISNLSSTAEQAAIADKLGLSAMLPAIREGTAAIDEARAAASRLGFVMDDALVQKGGEANDRMEDLAKVLEVQINSALVEMAPLMVAVGSGLAEAARSAGQFAGKLDELNKWAASKDLLAVFRWANNAGDAFGKATGLNRTAGLLGFKSGPAAPQASAAGIRAAMAPAGPKGGGKLSPIADPGAGRRANQVAKASQAAIDAALKDELAARTALVDDLQAQAELQKKAVDQDAAAEVKRLQAASSVGDITKAAAATAIALTQRAAGEKKQLIDQEVQQRLADEELAQRQAIGAYYDRIASITADMASSAAERNAIEAKNMADRQALERRELATRQEADRSATEMAKAAERAAQLDLQAAERAQQEREAKARLEAESNSKAEAALQLQIDLLSSQAGLALTSYARGKIEERILALQHELERLSVEEILHSTTATDAERAIAEARLKQLKAIQGNEAKARRDANSFAQGIADAASALEGMASAIKSHDWGGALSGLANTFNQIGGLLGSSSAFGSALGKVGKVLGPIGSIVSSVTSIFSGIFGSNKRKRAERVAQQQEEAQAALTAAQDAATKATDLANTKRELEIQLMEASGDAAGALAARRADELGAMDESLRGLQLQLYAYQDAAAAAANLAEVQADGAAKIADAREQLATAYERESSALQDTIDKLGETAKSLRDYGKSLSLTGPGMSAGQSLAATSAAFRKAVAGGDTGSIQTLADAYLNALQATAPDQFTLARGRAEVMRAVEAAAQGAEDQATVAEQQLQALNDQVGGLIEVNKSVLSVRDAITNLSLVTAQVSASIAAATPTAVGPVVPSITPSANPDAGRPSDFAAYVDQNADLLNLYNSHTGMARGRTKEQFGQYHYANFGKAEGRLGPPGFGTGGSFTMGGFGGTDSQLAQMRLTPGEIVNISRGDTMSQVLDQLRSLNTRLDMVAAGTTQTAVNTGEISKLHKRWDGDGMPDVSDREFAA